jgi:hypothetical protein
MRALHKYLGNPVLTGIGRLFFNAPCGDFHCGLRGFTIEAQAHGLATTGMEFASEMVVKARYSACELMRCPPLFPRRPRPPSAPAQLARWLATSAFLAALQPALAVLVSGLVLMILGAVAGLLLLPGPRIVGTIRFDVNSCFTPPWRCC